MKEIQVQLVVTVMDPCPGETCDGADHNGVGGQLTVALDGVPPGEVREALLGAAGALATELGEKIVRDAPWVLTGGSPPPGMRTVDIGDNPTADVAASYAGSHEWTQDAPTARELAETFGDPERPRNVAELAEVMVRNGAGVVNIAELAELAPLKEALRVALERDPDRA